MVTRETSISNGLSQMGIQASDQAIHRLARLAEVLENDAVDLGFLGPNEGQRIISRHILESAALEPLLPQGGPIVDVGSGAGLPGLVLAAMGRPMVLIESLAKRASFLRDAAAEIGTSIDVRTARAEDEGRRDLRDAASGSVARALAALPVSLELCLPFVRPGGLLAILASPHTRAPGSSSEARDGPGSRRLEGSDEDGIGAPVVRQMHEEVAAGAARGSGTGEARGSAAAEPRDSDDALSMVSRQLGGGDVRWVRLPVPGADPPRWVMMVDKREPTPERFPRRPGVPKRRPLGGDVASVN